MLGFRTIPGARIVTKLRSRKNDYRQKKKKRKPQKSKTTDNNIHLEKSYALVGSVLQPDWLMDMTICASIILHTRALPRELVRKHILLSDVSDGKLVITNDPHQYPTIVNSRIRNNCIFLFPFFRLDGAQNTKAVHFSNIIHA